MRNWNRALASVLAAIGILAWSGCRKESDIERSKRPRPRIIVEVPERNGRTQETAVVEPEKPKESPRPTEIPKVVLSSRDLESCRVKVGDAMPDAELPDLEGRKQDLRSRFGKKLTVLLFWTEQNPYAVQAMQNLQSDAAQKYAGKGVETIAVAVKDSPQAVREAIEEGKVKYLNLLDADGSYAAKITTDLEKLPRLYLLDAQGKVLWFDVEYSDTTQQQLDAGIQVGLERPGQ